MARAYSSDLREKVASFVDRGHSRRMAASVFGVSPSFVIKLMTQRRETGSLAAGRVGGSRGKLAEHRTFVLEAIAEAPDQTMPELAARILDERGVKVAPASLSRFLIRCGLTRKKSRSSRTKPNVRMSPPNGPHGLQIASPNCAPSLGC